MSKYLISISITSLILTVIEFNSAFLAKLVNKLMPCTEVAMNSAPCYTGYSAFIIIVLLILCCVSVIGLFFSIFRTKMKGKDL